MTLFQEWRSTTPAYEPLSSQAPLLPTSHSSDKSPALYSLHSRRPSRSFLSNAKSVLSGCRLWVSLFQLAVVVLACFGISQFVEQKLGRLIRVHRLSDQELSQVGWSRPPLRTTFTSSPTEPAHSHARPLVHDFQSSSSSPQTIQDQHLLILTPCRNCATTLPRYFELVESLDHPKDKTSIGFLVSDDTDDTVDLMSDFITRHQDEYRQLTLLRKDFSLPSMLEGPARHSAYLQDQRR